MNIPDLLQQVFSQLNASNVDVLDQVYADNIQFEDPAHKVNGLINFKSYCTNLYQNVTSCKFNFNNVSYFTGGAILEWDMLLQHPKLNRGKIFTVPGVSIIHYENKIYSQRDYFDLGAMLYEQLPLIGWLIRIIKRKLGQ